MTREDKLRMLLHPDQYTEEQLDQMLQEINSPVPDTEEAWNRFERETINVKKTSSSAFRKIAAMFIGTLLLSGITIAAIQYIRYIDDKQTVQKPPVATTQQQPAVESEEPVDTLRTFENEELEDILSEIADYYHLRTEYRDDEIRHIRLYIKWNKMQSAEAMVERLNGFEKVNVILDKDLLCAE